MSKHTLGPWEVSEDDPCEIESADGRFVAMVLPAPELGWDMNAEREANARLIAAAPDLLAALQAACDTIDLEAAIYSARAKVEHETANTRSAGNLKAKVNFFRATIAKATGGDL